MPNSISLSLPLQSSIPFQTFLNNIKTITQSIVSYGTDKQLPTSNLFIGQRYFNTDTQTEMIYNGTGWISVGSTSTTSLSANLTLNGMVYATGSTSLQSTIQPINGQLLIGSTGFPPALATLSTGTGISITNGPSSITIINTGVTSITGATNNITASASAGAVSLSISSSYIGQTSITTLGSIVAGTWNGSTISGQYGGTGVNNATSTITIGGNVTFSGGHTFIGTLTGNTNVTFPTSGTLSTTTGTVTSVNITPGTGISASGGPITSSGSITVTNTGVTSLAAGTGISLSGSTGAITITNTVSAPTGSNPTATIGLTTVNGSSTAFLRSDAAPALNVGISPTWTGTHLWTGLLGAAMTTGVSQGTSATNPYFQMTNGSGGTDSKFWQFFATTTQFTIQTVNDGQTAGSTILSATRSGQAVATINLGNITDKPPVTLFGEFAINSGTPTSQLTGFGTPTGSVISGLNSSSSLSDVANTLAALLSYLKAIGFIGT